MNDFELLRDLRAMRRPAEPAADLWPAIAARIAPAAGAGPAPRRPMWPEALAASLVLGLGALLAFGTRESSTVPAPASVSVPAPADGRLPWSVREAMTLDAAFAGALAEARRAAPAPGGAVLRADRELEAAQRALEDALAQQPEAVHLLDLLRRTHEQRLRLAQRQASMG